MAPPELARDAPAGCSPSSRRRSPPILRDEDGLPAPSRRSRRCARADHLRAEELGDDLLPLDGEHPALVHLAPALVGPSDPGLVRARRRDLRRRGRRPARRRWRTSITARPFRSSATRTCSTPGSPRRCGRSRTLGWPDKTPELARYYPTDVLVTGFDIIFFWVARMMMMGLHFMDEVPFRDVYIHALVRDEKGQKMSKSKGNVIDPLELIDNYGADALALHAGRHGGAGARHQAQLLARRGLSQFRDQAVERRALRRDQRLRAAAGLRSGHGEGHAQSLDRRRERARRSPPSPRRSQAFRFNEAAGAIYHFIWHVYLRLVSRADQADPRREPMRTRPPRRAP